MNVSEAKQLTRGDRVMLDGDPLDCGTVRETTFCSCRIEWNHAHAGFVDHDSDLMRRIQRAPAETAAKLDEEGDRVAVDSRPDRFETV